MFDWNALLGVWREGGEGAVESSGIAAINITYSLLDPYTTFIRFVKSDLTPPKRQQLGLLQRPRDGCADAPRSTRPSIRRRRTAVLIAIEEKIVNEALFLFVAHDLNPRALSPKVHGFVQAQSWFQDSDADHDQLGLSQPFPAGEEGFFAPEFKPAMSGERQACASRCARRGPLSRPGR